MEKDITSLISLHMGRAYQEVKEEIANEVGRATLETCLKNKLNDYKAQLYRAELLHLFTWFQTGARPEGISPQHWSALSELACSFVDRGEMEPEALLVFQ